MIVSDVIKKQSKKEKLNELLDEIKNIPYTTIEEDIWNAENNNVEGNPSYASLDEIREALLGN
jgi:hypothetical protein